MRWLRSWRRKPTGDRLVVAFAGQALSYLQARQEASGQFTVERVGVEHQGTDSAEAFQTRLQNLGLHGAELHVMLRPDQYQFLQIDVPAVPAEELRSAARYQIRDMVDTHLDDLTIDIMRLGDGTQKGAGHLYVVAAHNGVLRTMGDLAQRQRWPLTVIDIQETAQRNLQTALLGSEQRPQMAYGALMVISEQQALLTISANEELFYSRRLDLPAGFMEMQWTEAPVAVAQAYTPVAEYEPDYSGSTSYDYSAGGAAGGGWGGGSSDHERAQRVLVEVQRSLDLWDRTWTNLPLAGLRVFAGLRSEEMADWLSHDLGQSVGVLDWHSQFPALNALTQSDLIACAPLLGVLLRSESAGG